jgi:hypothetical protein
MLLQFLQYNYTTQEYLSMVFSLYKKLTLLLPLIAMAMSFYPMNKAYARKASFVCDETGSVPKTLVTRTINGKPRTEVFIAWTSSFGESAGYTPLKRCREVSPRFNKVGESGSYVTHGKINNLTIICVTNRKGNGCESMLFTLNNTKADSDPKTVIRDLFSVNKTDVGSDTPRRENCSAYVSIEQFLNSESFYTEVCR